MQEKNFFRRILSKPPFIFPWVALFHLLMLIIITAGNTEFSFPSEAWIAPFWLLLFTISWIFVCDLRRWAALLYILLTMLNLILHFSLKYQSEVFVYTAPFFLIYILFSFFILVYFRKFL